MRQRVDYCSKRPRYIDIDDYWFAAIYRVVMVIAFVFFETKGASRPVWVDQPRHQLREK